MSKRNATTMDTDFESPLVEEQSGRGFGLFAVLAILTVIGVVVWFMMSHNET